MPISLHSHGKGYMGQRYEVRAKRPPGDAPDGVATEPFVVGWTELEDGGALVRIVEKHPTWKSPEVVDLGAEEFEREPGRGLGFVWTPTMRIGSGCRVHLREDELPGGRLVVSVSKHYVAVIDGVIHDTHDPSERGSTVYPPNFPRAELPKGATRLSTGGWAYSPERCVYGYWTLTREAA